MHAGIANLHQAQLCTNVEDYIINKLFLYGGRYSSSQLVNTYSRQTCIKKYFDTKYLSIMMTTMINFN